MRHAIHQSNNLPGYAARCAETATPFRELANEFCGSAAVLTGDSIRAAGRAAQPQESLGRFPVRQSHHRTATGTARRTADTSVIEKAGAPGGLKDAAKRGMTNSTKLNGIVRVKYQNNPQKLAARTVASHLEKPPKKKQNPTP